MRQKILNRFSAPIRSSDFTFDGKYLVDSNYLGFLIVRDVSDDFKVVNVIAAQTTIIETVKCHPSKYIAFVAGAGYEGNKDLGVIKGIDIKTGEKVSELFGHTDDILDFDFFGDNSLSKYGKIVSVGLDGKVVINNIETGNVEYIWDEYGDLINTCCVNPKLNHVAIGGDSGETQVIDLEEKQTLISFTTKFDCNGLMWSQDGKYLIVGGDSKYVYYFTYQGGNDPVYKLRLNAPLKKMRKDPISSTHGMACGYDNNIWRFPLIPKLNSKVEKIKIPILNGVWGTSLSLFDKYISVPCVGNISYCFTRNKLNVLELVGATPKLSKGINWICAKYKPYLLSSHDNGEITIRLSKSGKLIRKIQVSKSMLMGFCYITKHIICVVDFSGSVWLIHLNSGLQEKICDLGIPCISVEYHKKKSTLYIGGYSNKLYYLKLDSQHKLIYVKLIESNLSGVIKSLSLNKEGVLYAAFGSGEIIKYNISKTIPKIENIIDTGGRICNGVAFNKTKNELFAVTRGQFILKVNYKNLNIEKIRHLHTRSIKAIHSYKNLVLTGSYDRTAILWDTELNVLFPPFRFSNSGIASVFICKKHIFIGAYDSKLACISVSNGEVKWLV